MTLDKLIEAVEKLHADALAKRNSYRVEVDSGKYHLVANFSFLHGEVTAYTRCLDMLKAKQAEGRE
jgi:hypothetical protein